MRMCCTQDDTCSESTTRRDTIYKPCLLMTKRLFSPCLCKSLDSVHPVLSLPSADPPPSSQLPILNCTISPYPSYRGHGSQANFGNRGSKHRGIGALNHWMVLLKYRELTAKVVIILNTASPTPKYESRNLRNVVSCINVVAGLRAVSTNTHTHTHTHPGPITK